MTINAYTLMAYVAEDNGQVTLRSENYPGQLKFNLHQIPANRNNFWGSYARAAHFYSEIGRVQRGIEYWQESRLIDFGRLIIESC